MIITCPACRTRYLIDDHSLGGAAGRTVRCANCGHTWHQAPEPPKPPEVLRIDPAPAEPPLDVPPRPGAERPLPQRRGRRGLAAVVWLVLLLLLAAAILAVIIGRDQVVAMWPRSARFYALAGLSIEKPGAGLEIRGIVPKRTADGLIINGEIVNIAKDARDVPKLRVVLRDAKNREVRSKIVELGKSRLLPGEIERFTTPFAHPPDTAIGVFVEFVSS